jgi:hypothetical protein
MLTRCQTTEGHRGHAGTSESDPHVHSLNRSRLTRQIGHSEGDSFRSDEEEIMEAARAARTSVGWERGVEVETRLGG